MHMWFIIVYNAFARNGNDGHSINSIPANTWPKNNVSQSFRRYECIFDVLWELFSGKIKLLHDNVL